jgi:hypothetical protein
VEVTVEIDQPNQSKEGEKQRSLECDTVYTVNGCKIVVVHGANLSLSQSSSASGTVDHVKKQAEQYAKVLKPDQAWVIVWTTRPSDHAKIQSNHTNDNYYFPQSLSVNTLYIYHDSVFEHVEVHTHDKHFVFEIPVPDFSNHMYESPKKRRKIIVDELIGLFTI